MDKYFLELAQQGANIVKAHKNVSDEITALCIDHNDTLSGLSASIGMVAMLGDLIETAQYTKAVIELIFYLGYLEGKNAPDLSLWDEQLADFSLDESEE